MSNKDKHITLKHFIITRFLCNSKMHLGEKVFDKEMIENGISLLMNYLMPSLRCQNNKNFELILMVHKNANREYLKPLYDLKEDFKITIIDVCDFDISNMHKYVYSYYNDYDYIVTSRIDYDDQAYYKAVEDVQNIYTDKPIYVYTYDNYLQHNIVTNRFVKYKNQYKQRGGGMALMLSLVINTHNIDKSLDIYSLGNHTKCATTISELLPDLKIEYDPLVSNTEAECPILYTVHENNDSGKLNKFRNKISTNQFDYDKFFGRK